MLNQISIKSVNRFTALIIGKSGIGKTYLLNTIPEKENVCVLSAESGLLCVRDLIISGRIDGFEINSFEDIRKAYKILLTEECKRKYKWIFIDSLTEISGRCVEEMKRKYPEKKGGNTFALWGDYSDTMTSIIKAFRDFSCYSVVFTCLPSIEKDENNCRFVGPSISGAGLKEKLTSYFDEVFYYDFWADNEGELKRKFLTQPIDRYPAKDRSGCLELFESPSIEKIKNKILKGDDNG